MGVKRILLLKAGLCLLPLVACKRLKRGVKWWNLLGEAKGTGGIGVRIVRNIPFISTRKPL
jgi:hypothetical protein